MLGCKPIETYMDANAKLTNDNTNDESVGKV